MITCYQFLYRPDYKRSEMLFEVRIIFSRFLDILLPAGYDVLVSKLPIVQTSIRKISIQPYLYLWLVGVNVWNVFDC